uniref:Uncharacterized protein n=1 Tax=Macaca fascicularis TaxID=9541 RepID=Q9BGX7_MACFA|nr:hypothetical protein [Macaca fascicularis]
MALQIFQDKDLWWSLEKPQANGSSRFQDQCYSELSKSSHRTGEEAHACNPSTLRGEAGGSPEVRSLRPAWPTWGNPISTKYTKLRWAWWRAPVIPATQEAEARESLKPGRRKLQ